MGTIPGSLSIGLEKGIAKIEKWHKATSQTDIAFTCLGTWPLHTTPLLYVLISSAVLDPRIKTEYAKQSWDAPRFNQTMTKFEKTWVMDSFVYAVTHTLCLSLICMQNGSLPKIAPRDLQKLLKVIIL